MGQRIIGVAAHPDDLEWYAGATTAKLARQGAEITFVVCTNGDKGTYDPNVNPHALAAERQREQRAAADSLGVREVIFLEYEDGELEPTASLRKRLAMLYRKYRPELLLAFDPWKPYEMHPDHLAAGRAALDARLAARMPLYYPGTAAWTIREVWLFNPALPNHYVDVSDALEAQYRALALHRSQKSVWDEQARQFVERNARANGDKIGAKYAEVFHRIVIEGALVLAQNDMPVS